MQQIIETIKNLGIEIDALIKNGEMGYSQAQNATGDTQLKLDIASDLIIERELGKLSSISKIISEEKDEAMTINEGARYTVCYDPLDGSSIVDANLAVGSIFGIYDGEPCGDSLVASAYITYGPRIEMVLASKNEKPSRYRYMANQWQLVTDKLMLGSKGKHNAPGGTQRNWTPTHKRFIDALFAEGYRLRYSGGMVPDLHHILVKGGGLFSYPDTSDKPDGKLRILFEVLPFALIFEMAGGEAVDHHGRRLLDITPRHPHDTTPCFFGSRYEIASLKKAYGVAQ